MSEIAATNEFVSAAIQWRSLTRERVATRLDGFVFVSLLVLVPLVAIPYGAVEQWWIALYECAVFGLAAISIIGSLLAPGERNARSPSIEYGIAALFDDGIHLGFAIPFAL